MHIHILGICGTFMAGVASIAKQLGHTVSGCDAGVYPPMSTYLQEQGIDIIEGYDPDQLALKPDCFVIGNAMSRGNSLVEAVLAARLPFLSGPQWLAQALLKDRWVLAVAGTHGKTTTSSILTWLLTAAGLKPGYLIGGIANNFSSSAHVGDDPFFVIEADEYDTAFFDKHSKFLHYHPMTAILNNLEYDHADIFPDLAAIQRQFHFLVRTIPSNGLIIRPQNDAALDTVIEQGCWTPLQSFGLSSGNWQVEHMAPDGSAFDVLIDGKPQGHVQWNMIGEYNVSNALAAIAAARHAGVPVAQSLEALSDFQGIKRRMEIRGKVNGITVYDDFAHHPTAIAHTVKALRDKVGQAKIIAVLEFGSNTMKAGIHGEHILEALVDADQSYLYHLADSQPINPSQLTKHITTSSNIDTLIQQLRDNAKSGDHVLIMSNKGFGGIHQKLLDALAI